jgi:hypothetical protein
MDRTGGPQAEQNKPSCRSEIANVLIHLWNRSKFVMVMLMMMMMMMIIIIIMGHEGILGASRNGEKGKGTEDKSTLQIYI